MTEAERVELADGRRRNGTDRSRRTWLDLQVGDCFPYLGMLLGVLWVGPIEQQDGYFARQVAVMPVAGGHYRIELATDRRRLHDWVKPAESAEAVAKVAAAWREMVAGERAELEQIRMGVAA